ncbi:MAG: hypothetical protein HGGPFJEG_00952 [Ignavibacteria bacterium]|nr:hypothetical protein [Ignavibacteria bacterium]
MKTSLLIIPILAICVYAGCSNSDNQPSNTASGKNSLNQNSKSEMNKNIYDLNVKTMEGESKNLSDYRDKVLLIVNVASKCGYTKQYEGLENIFRKYKEKGFEILGFPCNDFGGQEPGTNDEIRTFCESKYDVTFTLFDKIKVLGEDQSPLYERLTKNSDPAGDVEWNFEKFIIDRKGDIVYRFRSNIKPESDELVSALEKTLFE